MNDVRLRAARRSATAIPLILILTPWVVIAAARPIVELLTTLVDAGVPLPLLRSRADFDASFYAGLVRARLVLPGILSSLAGILLWITRRDVERGRATRTVTALRLRLAARPVWLGVTTVIVVAVALHTALLLVSPKGNDYDASQIVEQALVRAEGDTDRIVPFRDPLSPALLAVQIRFDPRLRDLTPDLIEVDGPHQIPLKQHNVAVIAIGLLVLGLLLRRTIPDPVRALGAWAIVVTVTQRYFVPALVDVNMSEPHGFLMLALTALAAVSLVERATLRLALLLGGALGLLTLAKGSFLLVAPVFVVLLCVLLALDPRRGVDRRRALVVGSLVSVGFLIAHAPFAAERVMLGHGLSPSDRGGVVLAIRAGYQDLESADWRAIVATGGPVSVERWGIDPEDLRSRSGPGSRTFWKSGSDFFTSDREAYAAGRPDLAHSFYARGVASCVAIESAETSESCTGWALDQFRERPTTFARLTAMTYWTDAWFVIDSSPLDLLLNLIIIGALHVVIVASLVRHDAALFALSALPIGLLAFHALATAPVNEPRHMLMMVGLTTAGPLVARLRGFPTES